VIGSRRACLASREAVIGSQRTFVVSVSIEPCFQGVAIGALATLTFLCLRTRRGLMLPPERSCSNFSWSKWMTTVSTVDPTSHYNTWFSAVEKQFPSGVAILFSIKISIKEKLTKLWREGYKQLKEKLQVSLLRFWGIVPVKIWSARDHFVPLTMWSIES